MVNDINKTTLRLYPVCECGYVFRNLICGKEILTCKGGYEYSKPYFNPSKCPVCHREIETILYKDFDMLLEIMKMYISVIKER